MSDAAAIPCRLCLLTSDADTVAASCVSATLALLRGTRVHAATLDAGAVDERVLARFDAVLITGGEPRRLRDRLSGRGASAIRAFVAAGGGYVGVCAGAVLATQKAPTLDCCRRCGASTTTCGGPAESRARSCCGARPAP